MPWVMAPRTPDRRSPAVGQLFAWRSNTRGQVSPEMFNGTGSVAAGHFIPVQVRNGGMAGGAGGDEAGGYGEGGGGPGSTPEPG